MRFLFIATAATSKGGKNLFDESTLISGYYNTSDPTSITSGNAYRTARLTLPAGSYTFSTDLVNPRILRVWYDGTNHNLSLNRGTVSFTTSMAGTVAVCWKNTSTTAITQTLHTMIERGFGATTYEAYQAPFTAGQVLFDRDDAERAIWTVEEYRLEAEFPYLPNKAIARGMQIAFRDEDTGERQYFEVRKVETREPAHMQAIVAEHIAVAELSDEHIARQEITNKTASQALTTALSGTLWSVGTDTASGTQSADIAYGSVWDAINTIQENWNVYITPRVTWTGAGITGRYLDIAPAQGTWRGIRLSINKNADELGVTYDDTETLTALYGYGQATDNAPLTFASVTWTATSDHPAKPSGQTYLEDPAATAAYGRNGRARFGYYQNNNITSASVLLEKTWEALQATRKPRVTVDCAVADLYLLGYADQPMRLHDTAIVDVEPIGTQLQLEIIQLEVDLLDPTQTRPTIGAYIPNIVYITRKNTKASSGRGGGGGRGQTNAQAEWSEYYTEITANNYNINLVATRVDTAENILEQAGLSINSQGVLVYSTDNVNMWQSRLNVQADRIGLVVEGSGANASIKAASIVAAINDSGSSVAINADHVMLSGGQSVQQVAGVFSIVNGNLVVEDGTGLYLTRNGVEYGIYDSGTLTAGVVVGKLNDQSGTYVKIKADAVDLGDYATVTNLSATNARITNLTSGLSEAIYMKSAVFEGTFLYHGSGGGNKAIVPAPLYMAGWEASRTVFASATTDLDLSHYHVLTIEEGTGADAGKILVTIGTTTTTAEDGEANFSIAATQTYISGVAAAETQGYNSGWAEAALISSLPATGSSPNTIIATIPDATTDTTRSQSYALSISAWNGNDATVYLRNTFNNAPIAQLDITAPGSATAYDDGWAAAYAKVSIPTSAANNNNITVSYPVATVDAAAGTTTYWLTADSALSSNAAYAYLRAASTSGTVVARVSIKPLYDAGWGAARALVSVPTNAATNNNITINYPTATVGGTAGSTTYWLTADSAPSSGAAYAYLRASSTSGTVVARVSTYALYTSGRNAGWAAARAKVSYPTSASTSGSTMTITVPDSTVDATQTLVYKVEANSWSGNTITVDIKGNSSGTTFARTTVDATARYNAGVSSGWNSAAATVNRVEDTSAKTLTFRYPTTYPDSSQSVYYLGATVSTSGSASSYTNYTWNVGLGTTWKYLFFTASIGGITRQIAVQVRINASNVTPS